MTTMLDPAALDRLAAEAWDAMLELHPLFATTLGDRRFDRLVPPATPEEAAVGAARLRDLRARLDDLGDPAPGRTRSPCRRCARRSTRSSRSSRRGCSPGTSTRST